MKKNAPGIGVSRSRDGTEGDLSTYCFVNSDTEFPRLQTGVAVGLMPGGLCR